MDRHIQCGGGFVCVFVSKIISRHWNCGNKIALRIPTKYKFLTHTCVHTHTHTNKCLDSRLVGLLEDPHRGNCTLSRMCIRFSVLSENESSYKGAGAERCTKLSQTSTTVRYPREAKFNARGTQNTKSVNKNTNMNSRLNCRCRCRFSAFCKSYNRLTRLAADHIEGI